MGPSSRDNQVSIAWVACLVSTNQQKHIHCREASAPVCLLSPHSTCNLGIMGCLGRACLEVSPHFGPHSAINRLNRLVYSTQVGQPFKLQYPRNPRTSCGRNKRNTRPQCGFRFFNGTTVFSSGLFMKLSSSLVWKMDTISFAVTDLWTETIFALVRVIDERSRAFAVLWLDHVARTHEPQSDRMLQECIIHSLIDDGLTEILETAMQYHTA